MVSPDANRLDGGAPPEQEGFRSFEFSHSDVRLWYKSEGNVSEHLVQDSCDIAFAGIRDARTLWGLAAPSTVKLVLFTDETFRNPPPPRPGPRTWAQFFLTRDIAAGTVDLNTQVFDNLPHEAERQIKHEMAHGVVGDCVDNTTDYFASYFLCEATAGIPLATENLLNVMKNRGIRRPLLWSDLQTWDQVRTLGDDKNTTPFTLDLAFSTVFSAGEYLIERIGRQNILSVYREFGPLQRVRRGTDWSVLREAYWKMAGEDLDVVQEQWVRMIESRLVL